MDRRFSPVPPTCFASSFSFGGRFSPETAALRVAAAIAAAAAAVTANAGVLPVTPGREGIPCVGLVATAVVVTGAVVPGAGAGGGGGGGGGSGAEGDPAAAAAAAAPPGAYIAGFPYGLIPSYMPS